MTNDEARLDRLEAQMRQMQQALSDLQVLVGTIKQNQFAGMVVGGGGGGGAGVFFCLPTSLGAATGTWPSLTPATQTLTIYQVVSGTLTSLTTATVQNWYPAATVASKVLQVAPNGDGTYSAVAQSCT